MFYRLHNIITYNKLKWVMEYIGCMRKAYRIELLLNVHTFSVIHIFNCCSHMGVSLGVSRLTGERFLFNILSTNLYSTHVSL
jgi:hypothetical protein